MPQVLRFGFLSVALCLVALGQESDVKGLPPRAAPSDYQAQASVGSVTMGAEFKGHSIPTLQATYTTEDFVVVEVGLFGAPESRLKLAVEDFSLRINGKKTPAPNQPVDFVANSVKDPEWTPPEPPESKGSKTKLDAGGGGGNGNDPPPPPPKMPPELKRAMIQRVQKSTLSQGDRALPQAGLLFFQYGGQEKSIKSLELIYSGPAGKATLKLQP